MRNPRDMGHLATSRCEFPFLSLCFAHLFMVRQMDRFACLRLTERCADILLSIREEIHEAGNHVGIELQAQITKLVECVHRPSLQYVAHSARNREFARVHAPLRKHANRPFIQRYLKRDDTLQAIQGCAAELISTLDMFSVCP